MADDQKILFRPVPYEAAGLLEYIDMGDIGLPDIQRPFVWTATKVRDLFDSMYQGFPVGYLLFWENANSPGARGIGVGDKPHSARLVVDGQQRLTSLYAVMRGKQVIDSNYRVINIEIAFRPRDGHFAVADAAIRRDPEYIASISELWSSGKPVRKLINAFIEELRAKREISDEDEDGIAHNLDRLYDLRSYPFTALEIAPTVSEEQVAEIFVRINSQGVKLNQADFILTLMSVFWDEGRAELEQFCRLTRQSGGDGPSPFNHFFEPQPDQLLRTSVAVGFRRARLEAVYSVLRGKDLETGQFSVAKRDQQFAVLKAAQSRVLDLTHWHEYWQVLLRAGFRDDSMVSSETNLVYSYAMYLIGRRDFGIKPSELRELMARWFFMNALAGRYSLSPETTMEADLARLRAIESPDAFVDLIDQQVRDTLTEDFWTITLPNALATTGARSPYLLGYYAALNLLDARVLFSKLHTRELFDPALKMKRSAMERHHLFPKAYLRREGIEATQDINQIANLALVEWPDNADISDESPADYWPRMTSRFTQPDIGGSETELQRMERWHALPDGWQHLPYEDFLVGRRKLMAEVIRQGFAKLS